MKYKLIIDNGKPYEEEFKDLKDFLSIAVSKFNLYESELLRSQGYTNECFFNENGSLTKSYEVTLLEKKKYFYINFGGSGGFMISKEVIKGYPSGSVFNIKGYGTPNFNKYYGIIFDINLKELHSLRYDYRN